MIFWNSVAFSMIQQMLAIWSLVPLPFLKPAWTSGSSQSMRCWSLTWRILSITLLVCEMSAIVGLFEHSLALPFFGTGMKTDLFQSCGHCWVFQIGWHIEFSTLTRRFSSVQLLSRVQLFVTPWTAARQASLSTTNSQRLLKLISIESVMPSNHLILCHPLLLLPSIFPSTRVFSNESVLRIRWPKYWSFSFSISPSNEYSGLISFRTD